MMSFADNGIQIIGVPLDLGAARRGTDGGPSALRVAGLSSELQRLGYHVEESDIVVPSMETRSAGNATCAFKAEILQTCCRLAEVTKATLERHHFPLVIGGDHSVAQGTVTGVSCYYRDRNQAIGLIWFDAHGDMNTPATSPSGNIHGMPLAHLLGYGDCELAGIMGFTEKVRPEHVALVGVRELDRQEQCLIQEAGVHTFTMRDIDERGMAAVCREVLTVVNQRTAGFHLSFDVDVCDPSVMPGSGTLVPGGVSFREAHLLLEHCADSGRMLSMELVELNPFLDHCNMSAKRCVSLLRSAFGSRIL